MSLIIPFSDACERNKDVILDTIGEYLKTADTALEIGSGTGQHAIYFAQHNPHLTWQTSDQQQHLVGLAAQLQNADVVNVLPPIELNVTQSSWCNNTETFDLIYTSNTLHIMRWREVELLFSGLQRVAKDDAVLIVYGPFKYDGEFTSLSNQVFDQSLNDRGCGSGIRDFEEVDKLAREQGFSLLKDQAMPANNQCLVWRKQG